MNREKRTARAKRKAREYRIQRNAHVRVHRRGVSLPSPAQARQVIGEVLLKREMRKELGTLEKEEV